MTLIAIQPWPPRGCAGALTCEHRPAPSAGACWRALRLSRRQPHPGCGALPRWSAL